MKLVIVPVDLSEARFFIAEHHRHHQPPQGHKFSLAVADESGAIRGVACIGRPIARQNQDGWTLEVTRVATDGCPNACSALYSAAWRVTRNMGYRKLITYTLTTEPGTSLRAAGWKVIGTTKAQSWDRPSRPRIDKAPLQAKLVWEAQ